MMSVCRVVCFVFCCVCVSEGSLVAAQKSLPVQNDRPIQQSEVSPDLDPTLRNFDPVPALKVRKTNLKQAKFQVIDVHTHFGFRLKGDRAKLADYVRVMDANNIAVSVSMDAKLGQEDDHLNFIGGEFSNRLVSFVHLDFIGEGQGGRRDDPATWSSSQPGFVRTCVEQLKVAKSKGVLGLKFFKSFGLTDKNADGSLLKIDDARWDPIWKACGELGLPVIMHVADPAAFFLPIDEKNERWEELSRHPDWSFYGDQFPSREELLAARNSVIARHPKTTFIGAHFANNSEDLAEVAKWLDEYPNLVVEFASRINELGRQPYTSRQFFIEYQDRILFGTDGPFPELRLSYYWRFLETFDQNFPYSEKSPPPQGMWRIHGIGLPDDVLRKVYRDNAIRILPRLSGVIERANN
jgi:predicted TIM-barrel fold metal-dependent hydrolase